MAQNAIRFRETARRNLKIASHSSPVFVFLKKECVELRSRNRPAHQNATKVRCFWGIPLFQRIMIARRSESIRDRGRPKIRSQDCLLSKRDRRYGECSSIINGSETPPNKFSYVIS